MAKLAASASARSCTLSGRACASANAKASRQRSRNFCFCTATACGTSGKVCSASVCNWVTRFSKSSANFMPSRCRASHMWVTTSLAKCMTCGAMSVADAEWTCDDSRMTSETERGGASGNHMRTWFCTLTRFFKSAVSGAPTLLSLSDSKFRRSSTLPRLMCLLISSRRLGSN